MSLKETNLPDALQRQTLANQFAALIALSTSSKVVTIDGWMGSNDNNDIDTVTKVLS